MKVRLKKLLAEAKARALAGRSGIDLTGEQPMNKVSYDHDDIQLCLDLLNGLTVTGISNAEKVAVIAQKLMNPLPEEKGEGDGSNKEEHAEG